MSCQVEQIADCGDISSLGRALFIPEREDENWLLQCSVSISSCGNLLAVGYKNRLCLLTAQWISSANSNSFLISWSGTLPAEITTVLAVPICPSHNSSQNGPDWFCIIVGFKNGNVGFYTNTGHLLLLERLHDKSVMKISCHTGTYGTLPDDIHILFQNCECIISGSSLFQTLRNAKAQLAKVHAGIQDDYSVDSRGINIRKWMFSDQDVINDAAVVGLELKNTYDHLLAASTYGGYNAWYRSVPPVNTLILGAGAKPYIGFHYALEGGTTPPLQDVARAVANKIKSALPGWLGGGGAEHVSGGTEPLIRSEALSMRSCVPDAQRHGQMVAVSMDRRLAAFVDGFGRVAVLDVARGHLIRLFKGCRDAQCAFVQIFEVDDKKPQLSVVKEIRRAVFLIIYNPKKGLIDIRLMQRGTRVAVFTATKNGKLIYNTCGLVGAEKNYTNKKLNLPEVQCVLIDPDGKLKKFNIPFYYALEGEHSQRSKDLSTLRDLRDYVKKTSHKCDGYENELLKRAADFKTLELKKHCIEMLIRNYDVSPRVVMACLNLFWDSLSDHNLNIQEQEIKHNFANLGLVTLFFRQINNDDIDDMQHLTSKICLFLDLEINENLDSSNNSSLDEDRNEENDDKNESEEICTHLLEDDNCILERLLHLTRENNYKEPHARVTFADNRSSVYKEFVGCFALDKTDKYITLKSDISSEKMSSLASVIFKSLFIMNNTKILTRLLKECNIDPREIVKLLIMQLMNTPLAEITLELIEKLILILYYICSATDEATNISYNELSPWWENIRDTLIDMACPLRSMTVAMGCKAVGKMFEEKYVENDEGAWESVSKENAKWGLLIGKLEDISILSIILMFKDSFNGPSLPKLQIEDYNINLKYIYTRGKGSVTELIAKWLCGMGVVPEAIIANELMDSNTCDLTESDAGNDEDGALEYLFVQNNRVYVDENPKIFKWLSLLRRQFPLSTAANYIIANMCWEYSIAWQKDMQNMEYLVAVNQCLSNVSNLHIRLGLFSIIWSTYIKHTFESTCRLVNKVSRLPKDPLCLQDVGFNNSTMIEFLQFTTEYLNNFLECASTAGNGEKQKIKYEKIWDESMPSLVEVAQNMQNINYDILNLNFQISCAIFYQCHFNIKFSKPLDTLYDIDYQYIFEALTGNVTTRDINMKASEKLRNPRMKFLTKLIRNAVETITSTDGSDRSYNCKECIKWIEKVSVLAELWQVDNDFINRQQTIALYHMGYDELAENLISLINEPEALLQPLLAITIQRLKRSLEHSTNQPEWIVTVPPHLYKRLQNTVQDASIPAHPSLTTTVSILQKLLQEVNKKSKDQNAIVQNVKLAELIIDNCEVLLRRKL